MNFGNLGFTELLMILVIVLVLFGARRVPEIGASIGKGIREFKKNISEADREIREPIRESLREARSAEPLGAGEAASARRTEEEAVRPEPKRLM
ncbi:MAG TPA: twin-arginine translocase TatA/TatE family subunit [Gemmatimonadaceae bacterium]|nr:twin-arginine translocase TatA/TatE family subunit [Gemmatimonadaceae bacterium]